MKTENQKLKERAEAGLILLDILEQHSNWIGSKEWKEQFKNTSSDTKKQAEFLKFFLQSKIKMAKNLAKVRVIFK